MKVPITAIISAYKVFVVAISEATMATFGALVRSYDFRVLSMDPLSSSRYTFAGIRTGETKPQNTMYFEGRSFCSHIRYGLALTKTSTPSLSGNRDMVIDNRPFWNRESESVQKVSPPIFIDSFRKPHCRF